MFFLLYRQKDIDKIIDSRAKGHVEWSLTDQPLRPLEQTQVHSPG